MYGLLKKAVPLGAAAGLTAEGVVLGPAAPARSSVLHASWTGDRHRCTGHGWGHVLLLDGRRPGDRGARCSLYGARRPPAPAAPRLGTLLYVTPTLQFLWGVLVVGEAHADGALGRVRAESGWPLVIFTADLRRGRPRRPPRSVTSAGSRSGRPSPPLRHAWGGRQPVRSTT